jgi:predicted DNA-binding protein
MPVKRTLRRVGRPPAGARVGEKVKDYPQLGLRIPAEAKAKLQALSVVSSRPQWRLLSEAIDCYLRARPAAEKREVRQLISRSGRKASSAHSSRRSR